MDEIPLTPPSADKQEDIALLFAWKLYFALRDAYLKQKQSYQAIRQWMILLSLLASVLAVLVTQAISTWLPIIQIVWLLVFLPGIVWKALAQLRHVLFYKPVLTYSAEEAKTELQERRQERGSNLAEAMLNIIKGRTTYTISRLSRTQRYLKQSQQEYRATLDELKANDPHYQWQYRVVNVVVPVLLVAGALGLTPLVVQLTADNDRAAIQDGLRIILIALPISIGTLLAYASEFTPSKLWVIYRHTSQRILREIYLYRAEAGLYAAQHQAAKTQTLLTEVAKAKAAADSLSGVAPYLLDDGQLTPLALLGKIQETPNSLVTLEMSQQIAAYHAEMAQTQAAGSNGSSSAASSPPPVVDLPDDGLSPLMGGEDYIRLRVKERREWYGDKIAKSYRQTKRTRQLILLFSAIGALAAGIGLSLAWLVVLTTAIATAITALHQLTLNSAPLDLYQQTAFAIDNTVTGWRLLPTEQRAKAYPDFVQAVEGILQQEEDQWFTTALQVLAHLDQSLSESADKLNPAKTTDDQQDTPSPAESPSGPTNAPSTPNQTPTESRSVMETTP